MIVCEQCEELCSERVKPCPFSGLLLCAECAYDEGIQAEERHLENLENDARMLPVSSNGTEDERG